MRTLLLFITIALLGASSCKDPISLNSLCIINLTQGEQVKKDDIICWTDKEKGEGFTLGELQDRFSVDEVDLRKITEALNQCQTTEATTNINSFTTRP